MLVAVTGGTGFVGAWSVRALVDAGHRVRLLVRPSSTLDAVAALGVRLADVEVVRGDVRDAVAVERLLDGCDALLHAAALVSLDDRDLDAMREVNVTATRAVLEAAAARGLDPIVHVASYAALFPSPDPVIGPDSPTAAPRSAYGRTKAEAEAHGRELQARDVPVVMTYPSTVVGPAVAGRAGIAAAGWQPLLRFRSTITFDGGMAVVDVRDVAAVHARAMRPGCGPRRYLCGGQMLSFDEMVDAVSAGSGLRIRRLRLPVPVVRGLGRGSDAVARLLRRPSVLPYEATVLLTTKKPTDDSRTLRELDLTWRPGREAIVDALRCSPPPEPLVARDG